MYVFSMIILSSYPKKQSLTHFSSLFRRHHHRNRPQSNQTLEQRLSHRNLRPRRQRLPTRRRSLRRIRHGKRRPRNLPFRIHVLLRSRNSRSRSHNLWSSALPIPRPPITKRHLERKGKLRRNVRLDLWSQHRNRNTRSPIRQTLGCTRNSNIFASKFRSLEISRSGRSLLIQRSRMCCQNPFIHKRFSPNSP